METLNVNNYDVVQYDKGEVEIKIPVRSASRMLENAEILNHTHIPVYLTIGELKSLLALAEKD